MAKNHKGSNKIYRLSLFDDRTHEQIKGVRFSGTLATIFLISATVVFSLVCYCLIAYTPIRQMIPGYPDAYSKKKAIESAIKIDSLENEILRWELYTENLHRVLTGDKTVSLDSVVKTNSTKYLKNIDAETMHAQDSIIKEKARRNE